MELGLVLSGGGARGIAHLGALQVFREWGLKPEIIAGTSAGAIIGALYAAGMEPEDIFEFIRSTEIFSLKKYAVSKPGFVDTEKFYNRFCECFASDNFSSLSIPVLVTATNLLSGSPVVFSEGELVRPILASAAFPGVFTPVRIGDAYYIDGGVLNNFPVDLVSGKCEKLIGIYVNPFEQKGYQDFKHSLSILERAYQIRASRDSLSKFEFCTVVISPQGLKRFGTFDLNNLETIYQLGYESALRTLDANRGTFEK
ncbi:patatin-like phospholipase family protein [Lentiprolixibacter aurantiacus]|uniref:Patatin-like phospholipase family protein n=1 Tax=Lentiprolixibacter aurantiacus TaxID=2993939 RepID=A0AAE3MPT4_9FLAO|nr:patatin-like phospholipase family protein [Lentiprolixibacter aurantiacus]MCX2720744.1 patatin-like phospholipase family protein [Lentiprolixibacter aurantiacus]